jgi:DUF438 domain-containing protein
VHKVTIILDDFRAGKRDVAEFWIPMGDQFIHIRYFALRDAEGTYKGTIEVSQNVTDIRNLEGEKTPAGRFPRLRQIISPWIKTNQAVKWTA